MPLLHADETGVTDGKNQQQTTWNYKRKEVVSCTLPVPKQDMFLQIRSGGTPTFQDASTRAFFTSVIGALVLSLILLIASSWPDAAAKALSCSWYWQRLVC